MSTVRELVALDLPIGSRFIELVHGAWENGNAVAPIDQRLSDAAKDRMINTLRPTRIANRETEYHVAEGIPVEDGDALVVATSGSSGGPKAVIHTHHSLRAALDAGADRLALRGDEHWLLCIPVAHVGGFLLVARHIINSSPLTVHERFDPAAAERAARDGATHVSLVATALQRIDPSAFSLILLGGAAVPPSLPDNVVATYGMTETMGGFAYNGRALPQVEIDVRDGEIFVRGPMLMRGYRDGTNPLTHDGFFPTGDLGVLQPDGTVNVYGRRGDLIISGAEKIWPAQVEAVLATHPNIRECAVRGVNDSEWGQRVVAWIVTESNTPTLEELRALVKESLPPYCAPREIRIAKAIPRTALGKVDTPALHALT